MILAVVAFGLLAVSGPNVNVVRAQAAAPTAPAAESTKHIGKVTAVDTTANTITINNKKSGDVTFTVSSTTKITLNKKAATLADVAIGDHATIVSADGKAADSIVAHKKVATKPAQ
jgi:3-dehydroquinate synthase class II